MPTPTLIFRGVLVILWLAAAIILITLGLLTLVQGSVMIALLILIIGSGLIFKHYSHRRAVRPDKQCERCGYDLKELPHPRCPECGALTGFRKSAEELGIAPDEMSFDNRKTL